MDFRRLFDLFIYQQAKYPKKVALASKEGLQWKSYSTQECLAQINRVSAGLLDLGLKKGDRVAIMTLMGSPYWNFLDIGMQQIGVVVVPIHATTTQQELEYVLRHSEAKYCIVANRELYEKVDAVRANLLLLKKVYTLQELPDVPNWKSLSIEPTPKHREAFQGLKASIHEDDLATIIYTSGTTGTPKGVMLSHKNIVSNVKAIISLVPLNWEKRALSFLPLSHIFERMVTYTYMAAGVSLYYAERRDTIMENMKEIKPHFFSAVPRLLESAYEIILKGTFRKSLVPRKIILWAIQVGKRYPDDRKGSFFYWVKRSWADILVYRYWRRRIGRRVQGVVVGAASLNPELGRLFTAAKIPVREGYGLTETSPVISFNRFEPGGARFGTVGIPIPGIEVKIENPDELGVGEIAVKGPGIMLGYYKEEELTKQVLSKEGWFRTGDLGQFVNKRFLEITDRKKSIFKTSSGKYVAPQVLENRLNSSPYIHQSMVLGYKRPFVSALIVPCFPILKQWCLENNVHWTAPQFMVINPKVEQHFQAELDQLNETLEPHQRVKRFLLLHESWSENRGLLTPTLKLKRSNLEEAYNKEIEDLYKSSKIKKREA